MPTRGQTISKRLTHGMAYQPIPNNPTINEKMLDIIVRPVRTSWGQPATQAHKIHLFIDQYRLTGKTAAAEFGNALLSGLVSIGDRQRQFLLAVELTV
jgi:hypothetical protein